MYNKKMKKLENAEIVKLIIKTNKVMYEWKIDNVENTEFGTYRRHLICVSICGFVASPIYFLTNCYQFK